MTEDQPAPPAIETHPTDVHSWLRLGIARGWATEDVCLIHDGLGWLSEDEARQEAEYEETPCVHGVRLLPEDVQEEYRRSDAYRRALRNKALIL